MDVIAIYEGPSPMQNERWMTRFVFRDDDGHLGFLDRGPNWQDRDIQWTGETQVNNLRPHPLSERVA